MGRRRKPAKTPDANSPSGQSCFARNRAVLRFGLTFGLVTLLYYVLAFAPIVEGRFFPAYLRANAQASSMVLNGLGQSCRVENATIRSPRFAITIKRGCDALEPSWLFCAAVLAFPASWRHRLRGIVAGVSLILTLNLVRIVSLYFLGIYTPAFFETMHLEVWPVLFIFIALGAWLFWVRWPRRQQLVTESDAS
jgi:exosortase H (IPTLxxWG-CTERM-specific)